MGKRSKRRAAEAREMSAAVVERHGFDSAGQLGHDGDYAVNVSERVALATDVVFACVRLIADLVADADVGEYIGRERVAVPHRLIRRPMMTRTRRSWLWQVASTMALYDGCWLRRDLAGLNPDGRPQSLVPIAPPRVSFVGRTMYVDAEVVDPDAMRWVPRLTFPTLTGDAAWALKLARQAIAAAWSADAYRADFWEHGGAPTTILSSDQVLSGPDAADYADRWVERRTESPGRPAVLGKGLTAQLFGADVAADGASAAAERVGTSVARYLGVPPWAVNVPSAAGSMTYNNAAWSGLDLVRFTLRPGYAGPIADALSDELPGDALLGRRAHLGLDHLTVGDALDRARTYQIATGGQRWMRPSEVRTAEHLPIDPTIDDVTLPTTGAPAPAAESIDA